MGMYSIIVKTKRNFTMHNKNNYLKNAELSTEQNYNMLDGIPNNTALPIPPSISVPEIKPLDKVKKQPPRAQA